MTVFGVQLDVMGFGSTIIDAHGVHCAQRRETDKESKLSK
jgi:hypothetical protein